ncbi:MAG: translation elongation factor Ts [Phycisphaerae bacterium]
MADITASMVKALRDETAQSMMECKKALQEADGDQDKAKDILRQKGLATAAKKAERETSEGLVSIKKADGSAAMVMVRCETDFTARNEVFQEMVEQVAELAFQADDGEVTETPEIKEAVQGAFEKIGENMSYGKGYKLSAPTVGSYLHHNSKVGVIVGVEGDVDEDTLTGLCMHIAFTDPIAINIDDVPEDLVEKEREFATQEAIASGKPEDIAKKMVDGKMRKFLAANALMEQPYVRDEKQAVKEVLGGAQVLNFARFSVA